MWPISTRLASTLTGPHTVVGKAEILFDGEVVATISPEGNVGVSDAVGIDDGEVQVQRATVRRTGTVTFLDPDNELPSLLVPMRGEVRLWRGAVYADATATEKASPPDDREYVPLITMVIQRPRSGGWPRRTVAGADRMWWVGWQKFASPWKIAPATTVATAMVTLLTSKLSAGRRDLDIPDTGITTTALTSWVLDEDSDPAEALANMAAAVGQVLYADPMGTIVARVEQDPSEDDAALNLAPGPGSVMLRPAVEQDASDAENAVVAMGETTDLTVPVRGYWQNNDPGSALYAPAVGVRARRFVSPLLATAEQATLAAQTIGRTQLGLSDTVAQGMLTHPGLDAGDVMTISDPDQGLDVTVVVDSFGVGLKAATMDVSCRTAAVLL